MKLESFEYTREDGEKTLREVMIVHGNKDYVDTIDLGHLTPEEIIETKKIQQEYEDKMAPFMKKAFRRFSKNKMDIHPRG